MDKKSESIRKEACWFQFLVEGKKLIGDDLSEEWLDCLYIMLSGVVEPTGKEQNSYIWYWWRDKPHQIGHRLIARLTRAEIRQKELEERVAQLEEELEALRPFLPINTLL